MSIQGSKERTNTRIFALSFVLACSAILTSCPSHDETLVPKNIYTTLDDAGGGSVNIGLSFYPGYEVEFHETDTLFCTTGFVSSLAQPLGSFDITLLYDPSVVAFESVFSLYATLDVAEAAGSLRLRASGMNTGSGDNIELFTITWKAIATGITDVGLQVDSFVNAGGEEIPTTEEYYPTIRILKNLGWLSFKGPGWTDRGNPVAESVFLQIENDPIREYDIDVVFDQSKMTLDETIGVSGVVSEPDGFVTEVIPGSGIINVKGASPSGIGPGDALELFTIHWNTVNYGRPSVMFNVNRCVTTNDVFIKPKADSTAISILGESKRPIVYVWSYPASTTVTEGEYFTTYVYLNLQTYPLLSYGINIHYDAAYLAPDKSVPHTSAVAAGADGFVSAVNPNVSGVIQTGGFDVTGKNPSPDFELLVIYWKALKPCETTNISLNVRDLTTVGTRKIDRIIVTEQNGWPVTVLPAP